MSGRLLLLSTKAQKPLYEEQFRHTDIFLIGQESAGVPNEVRQACDGALAIPLAKEARSLNMSVAAAIALAEARRQIGYETH